MMMVKLCLAKNAEGVSLVVADKEFRERLIGLGFEIVELGLADYRLPLFRVGTIELTREAELNLFECPALK
jgi:hypothetical protein